MQFLVLPHGASCGEVFAVSPFTLSRDVILEGLCHSYPPCWIGEFAGAFASKATLLASPVGTKRGYTLRRRRASRALTSVQSHAGQSRVPPFASLRFYGGRG